jgi:hypothetical protein
MIGVHRNEDKILIKCCHEKRQLEELKGDGIVSSLLIPAFILYIPSVILSKFLVINQRRMCATLWLQSVVMTRHATCPLDQFSFIDVSIYQPLLNLRQISHISLDLVRTQCTTRMCQVQFPFSVYTAQRCKKPQNPTLTTLCLITNLQLTLSVNSKHQQSFVHTVRHSPFRMHNVPYRTG